MNNMPSDEPKITKINLDSPQTAPATSAAPSDSILVPRIDVSEPSFPQNLPDEPSAPQATPVDPPVKKSGKGLKIALGILGFIIVFLAYNAIAGYLVYQKGIKLLSSAQDLSKAANTKDLTKIKSGMDTVKKDLTAFQNTYRLVSWAKILPVAGAYVSDGSHAINAGQAGLDAGGILLTAVQPYEDLLGLGHSGSNATAAKNGEQTTQQRIDFIIKTIPDILPKIDLISAKVKIVNDEVSQINSERYPENFKGKPLRAQIKNAQDLVSQASTFIVNGKPMLENAPYLLGMDSPRTYMILFQNDKELRPTGGFMTAYAIMKVDKAKFEPVSSNDIYNLDAQYKPSIPAPAPIIKYIKGPYILSQNLRLRDMNWSPDFPTSMQSVVTATKQVGINNIDGIIAVDTQLLENLLNAIGPIGVPGFGNFNTKIDPQCNCSQVIHELESFADVEGPIIWDPLTGKIIQRPPNSDNRKKIIGPLMNSILANALGQPKDKLPVLFENVFKSLIEKHVLFYILDNKVQTAVADFGLAGAIKPYNGDYLHINDANLGGRKSNLYAREDVEQDIKIAGDGTVTKTVTITYKNPEKQDGWLNSVLPTWVRVYVPQGSQLITSEGLETKQDAYDDLGKTVFSGFFQLRPEGVSKITFQYKLPFKVTKEYKLMIQKQPGTDGFLYSVKVGKHQDEFYLKTDKELKVSL